MGARFSGFVLTYVVCLWSVMLVAVFLRSEGSLFRNRMWVNGVRVSW